jgi:septal ring factor EnvC (AmiA/AmiB activator)
MGSHEIVPDPIQNDNDFKSRESEFEALSRELAERELELATLENELGIFETRYARTIGVLFAELDELEKEIAKELFRLHPEEKYKK